MTCIQNGLPTNMAVMKPLYVCMIVILAVLLGGCGVKAPADTQAAIVQSFTSTMTPYLPLATLRPTQTLTSTPTAAPTSTLIPLPQVVLPPTPTQGVSAITIENVQRVAQLATLGKGAAYDTSWSPDGRFFVVESSLGLYLYDSKTWEQVKLLKTSRVYDWSPDGRLLAAATRYDVEPGGVYLYDGETLEPVKLIEMGSKFSWSSDGRWLAIISSSNIYLYDAVTLELVQAINTLKPIRSLRFSPDGKTFATLDDQVRLWDVATGNLIRALDGSHEDASSLYAFTYNATGETLLWLASSGDGFDLFFHMWDVTNVTTGQTLYSRFGYVGYSHALAATFSPNGSQLALVIYDQITLLDSRSGKVLKTIPTIGMDEFIDGPIQITYSPDGQKLITTAGVFDVESGARLSNRGYSRFQLSPDGRVLAYSVSNDNGKERVIQLWDIEHNQLLTTFPGRCDWQYCASFSGNGQLIASFDGVNIQLHTVATGERLQQIKFDPPSVRDIAFSPITNQISGNVLAVSSGQLWEISDDQGARTFKEYRGGPVAISPDGGLLVYQLGRGVVQVEDIFTGQVLRNLTGPSQEIQELAYSPDGQFLAVGWYDPYSGLGSEECNDSLYFWNISTGNLLGKVEGGSCGFAFDPTKDQLAWVLGNTVHIENVKTGDTVINLTKEKPGAEEWYLSIAFSSDGHLLAAGTSTGLIDIWNIDARRLIRTLEGHGTVYAGHDMIPEGNITSMAFSPYGDLLASAGIDCTVRLWDANTGQSLRVFECLSGPVAFSPDGTLLAVGAAGGTVVLFGLPQVR